MTETTITPTTNEEIFKYYTAKSGDINRQFGLASIAVIWLLHGMQFKAGEELVQHLDGSLLYAMYATFFSLGLDLVQYASGSLIWGSRFSQAPIGNASDCKKCIVFSVGLIALKLLAMLIAYLGILYFLVTKTKLF